MARQKVANYVVVVYYENAGGRICEKCLLDPPIQLFVLSRVEAARFIENPSVKNNTPPPPPNNCCY